MILSLDNFVTYLAQWCELKTNTLYPPFGSYPLLKGGWEAWMQADFAAYLISVNNTYDVLREQYIYGGQQRVDWLVNSTLTPDTHQMLAVELKCESLGQYVAFVGDVKDDIAKLKTISGKYQTLMVAMFFEEEAKAALQALDFTLIYESPDNTMGCAVSRV